MHLGAADELLPGQQLVVREHLPVPVSLGDLHLGGHRQRYRSRGDHAYPELGRSAHQDLPVTLKVSAQIVKGVDDAAVHFDNASLQFSHVAVRQLGQQFRRTGGQMPGPQVDQMEFLFHAHRAQRHA